MDQLAAELKFSYRVLAADLDERALGAGAASPSHLVMLLAKAKAAALQSRLEAAAQPGGPDGASNGLPTPHGGPGLPAPCSSEACRADAPQGVAAANSDRASAGPAAQSAALREPDAAEGLAKSASAATKWRWAGHVEYSTGGASGRLAGLLVTCDQVVVCRGRVLEKPSSPAEARAFLEAYSQGCAATVGAVVVTNLRSGAACAGLDTAEVHFARLEPDMVDALVREGQVMRCAGALMVEHPLVAPRILRMVGALDSVQGLPKALLLRLLRRAAEARAPPAGSDVPGA